MEPAYQYRASLVRVIDGDTFELDVDLGFKVHSRVMVRLHGIDTPERHTPEGKAAQAFADHALRHAAAIVVRTFKDQQSFARWVADVWVDGQPLAEVLREAGYEKGGSLITIVVPPIDGSALARNLTLLNPEPGHAGSPPTKP